MQYRPTFSLATFMLKTSVFSVGTPFPDLFCLLVHFGVFYMDMQYKL